MLIRKKDISYADMSCDDTVRNMAIRRAIFAFLDNEKRHYYKETSKGIRQLVSDATNSLCIPRQEKELVAKEVQKMIGRPQDYIRLMVAYEECIRAAEPSKNEDKLVIGEVYEFAGYRWTPVYTDPYRYRYAIIQSFGVTEGVWPGFKMAGDVYNHSISERDIWFYDDKTRALNDAIKFLEFHDMKTGLYLPDLQMDLQRECWKNAMTKVTAANKKGIWIGNNSGKEGYAKAFTADGWIDYLQENSLCIAPAFTLDLSKVNVVGDKISKIAI